MLTAGDERTRQIVARAQDGDREAFNVLATSVVDRLYAVARLILRDTDQAEDAVQETLIRCWRDLPSLRDPARFDAWINRILVHAVADSHRRYRRQPANVRLLPTDPSTPDETDAVALREQLGRAFSHLSVEHRTIVVLRFYLELSVEATGTALGIPPGTVKSRLHYATEALRAALEADARPLVQEAFS